MRSAPALTVFMTLLPLQKKYRDSPTVPSGIGTASRAAFMAGGTGRNTGWPFFSVCRNILHAVPSWLIRSRARVETSPIRRAVYRKVGVTPQNGFIQAVSFSCSGLPSGDSCTFSPSTLTPSGAAANTALTIGPATSSASQSYPPWKPAAGGMAIALLLWPFRRRTRCGIAVIALCAAVFVMIGCGAGSKPQQYSMTVTASGGGVTQTTPISLTVIQ